MKAVLVKDLCFSYPGGDRVLDSLCVEIDRGMKVAMVGGNGSGKTTFLLHLNGLLDGTGHIEVLEMARSRRNIRTIRSRIGLLLNQAEYQFIMPDLLNDVILSLPDRYPDPEERKARALYWISRFGLEEYANSSPLDLSSGEMKRAALAGVFAREPEIVLLDEPLNTIDRGSSMVLLDILRSMEQTMVIATHRRLLVEEMATHVAVMEKGRVTGFYEKGEYLKSGHLSEYLF